MKLLIMIISILVSYNAMADYEKYTYDCISNARYYLNEGNQIQNQTVDVGTIGFPNGYNEGLIRFEHQVDGTTFYLVAQGGLGSYIEDGRLFFHIDLFRTDKHGKNLDSAQLGIFNLDILPPHIGLRLLKQVTLPSGGWVNFALECKWVSPKN